MSKLYIQNTPTLFNLSGSFAAAGSTSGSLGSAGYAKIVGVFRSDVVSETGSGLRIEQSSNGGTNWDIISASCLASACAASSFSVEVVGNAVRLFWRNGAGAASAARINFFLRPI